MAPLRIVDDGEFNSCLQAINHSIPRAGGKDRWHSPPLGSLDSPIASETVEHVSNFPPAIPIF
jgi:hypothetical protein